MCKPPADPAADVVPVVASNEAAADAEAKGVASGDVTVTVAGLPPSPQAAQALVEVIIGMLGTGVSVHPQCRVVMVVVMVVRPFSHTSQTSIQTAMTESSDSALRQQR